MLRWLWDISRPIIAFVLGGTALLGLLVTAFFTAIAVPHFPAGTMLALSLSLMLVLVLYEGAIRILSD